MNLLDNFEIGSLAYVGIFLGVLLAFEGLRQVLTRKESVSEARNRRMRMIAAGAKTEDMLRLLKPSSNHWRLERVPFIGTLPGVLQQAGLTIRPGVFLLACLGATATVSAAASTLIGAWVALPVAILLCFVLPISLAHIARSRRMAALIRQLPEALDLMARGLKVGHPLNATIASVAADMNDPVAMEFGIMVDQISYGDDLVNAFMDFADRTELEDVRYLSVSVAIQAGTGGNLAQVLGTLASVIRDRITMRKRIRAISSEGRLTSKFLSLLPVIIFAATSFSSPDYYAGVSTDPLFRPIAIAIVALVALNYLVMRRLVSFRI